MSTPTISVLMPVYNADRYVAKAVESILSQTFQNFEFVILNDGSTDGSSRILDRYAQKDGRIIVIEQVHSGYSVALNRGLGDARGEFVARMDSDDICLPDRLEIQLRYLREHSEVVVVGGQAIAIDEDDDPIRPINVFLQHESIDAGRMGRDSRTGCGLIHPAVLMRREVLMRVGGYRPEFEPAEDRDLWLRLAELGRLANVPQIVLKYRVHGKSVSQERAIEQHSLALRAIKEAYRRRGLALPDWIEMWSLEDRTRPHVENDEARALAAARSGYAPTALKYARRVIARRPWSRRAWKAVTICVLGVRAAKQLGRWRRAAIASEAHA